MSNPSHTPLRNDNIAIEQRTRMIKELNEISQNTATSSASTSTIIKGLTDIDDTDTAKNVKVNSSGHIEVAIVGTDTAGDQSLHPVKVNDNGEVFTQIRANHYTTLPTLSNGQGHQPIMDNKARLLTKSTLSGLTDIADETTGKNVRVNSIGEIATTSHMKGTDDTNTERDVKTDSTGKLITSEDKITVGNADISSGSLQSVLVYGKDSTGTLRPADTTTTGRLLVDVADINKSGKLTATPSLNSFQVCGYREDTDNFHTVKVSSDGTQYVKDGDLNTKWETDITNNIKGDIDSINTNTATMDGKMTRGEGNITGGGSGLFQTLCYGKDQSGNLDPLNVDSNGHLKITINDVESGITVPLNTSHEVIRSNTEITNDSSGSALSGTLSGFTYTETVDMDKFKEMTILIDATAGANLELWASHSSTTGFVYYSEMVAEPSAGIIYKNDSFTPRYFRIYNDSSTAYTFTSMRVHLAR